MRDEPVWRVAVPEVRRYEPFSGGSSEYDVVVVGGGITGLTTALLLKHAGKRVAVLEARHVGSGVTGSTTAHLTQIIDTRFHELEQDFGKDGARLAATSSLEAITFMESTASALGVDCDFRRVPGYLYAETEDQLAEWERELAAAQRSGVAVVDVGDKVPLPFRVQRGFRVDAQGQLHPLKYLLGLATMVHGNGSAIFEDSPVEAVTDGEPCTVSTRLGHKLAAASVVLATHSPLTRVVLQTKLGHAQSYVVAGPIGRPLDGLFWDLAEPYNYTRTHEEGGQTFLIAGGADHRTGMEQDTRSHHLVMDAYAARFGVAPTFRWSAQVVEPVDGLPFIGRNGGSANVYAATGYSGNGMTFSTVAARVISELILGRAEPYGGLYSAKRIKPLASLPTFLADNAAFPVQLLGTALGGAEARSLDEVAAGEGKTVAVNGQILAVYRDRGGVVHAVSSICTHLGCRVKFNAAATSWDCPCHGSRFGVDGEVLDGPATRPLEQRDASPPSSP